MDTIQHLSWLEGTWADVRPDAIIEETWLPPRGGTMLGVTRTVRDGKTTFEEYGRIGVTDSGLALSTMLGLGKPVLVYKVMELAENHVIFGNADDPAQIRIAYHRADNELRAVVTGVRDEGAWTLNFIFAKIR